MKRKHTITMIFVFLLMFLHASIHHISANSDARVGSVAPDFTLKTLKGESIKLSDYRGKKVLINFWTTWCPPCKREMPELERFSKERKDNLVVLAINIDGGNFNGVKQFVEDRKLSFPILLDEKDQVNQKYGVLSIPTSFFLDENGVIKHIFYTTMSLNDMKRLSK